MYKQEIPRPRRPVVPAYAQNEPYNFPLMMVCMWPGEGCAYSNTTVCASSAIGKWSNVVYGDQWLFATLSEVSSTLCVAC